MRTVLIFIPIVVFLTLIQYSTGAPRRVRSLDNDKHKNMMKNMVYKLKPYIDDDRSVESDESNEEEKKKVIDTLEFREKRDESSSSSGEQDKEVILSHFIDVDHEQVSEMSDED